MSSMVYHFIEAAMRIKSILLQRASILQNQRETQGHKWKVMLDLQSHQFSSVPLVGRDEYFTFAVRM